MSPEISDTGMGEIVQQVTPPLWKHKYLRRKAVYDGVRLSPTALGIPEPY